MECALIKTTFLGLLFLSLLACAAPPKRPPMVLQGSSQPLKPGDIIDTATGSWLTFEALIQNLNRAAIIYVGETHTRPEDHQLQLDILKALYGRSPDLILALEMFPREMQPLLDQYAQGRITEREFLEKENWMKNWGYPFDLYRGLLHWTRAKRVRIIGINAPQEVVDQVAKAGLAALAPVDRDRLAADIHADHPEQREYLQHQYAMHPRGAIKDFETFYEAQKAWEETMAETLARETASLTPDQHILVLIGKGHITHQWGVPRLTQMRVPASFRTVLPVSIHYPFRTLPPSMADYLYITP